MRIAGFDVRSSTARLASCLSFVLVLAVCCPAWPALAQSGEILDLSTTIVPPSASGFTVTYDRARTFVTGINDAREVAGFFQFDIDWVDNGVPVSSFGNRPYLWRDGTATEFGGLSPELFLLTTAEDINNDGAVAGHSQIIYTDSQNSIHYAPRAFVWDGGFTNLMPGNQSEPVEIAGSTGRGINSSRHVVGHLGYQATRWIGPAATVIGVPTGYYRSFGEAVNDSGVVVFNAYDFSFEYGAFMYEDDSGITDLGDLMDGDCCPDFDQTYANAINQEGTIVGWGIELSSKQAIIWDNGVGKRLRLDPFAVNGSEAMAINNRGQIVGRSLSSTGNPNGAYIWLPLGDGLYNVVNLNDILPANSPWMLVDAVDINENGDVVGHGMLNGERRPYLLQTGFGLTVNSIADTPDFNDTDGNGAIDGAESGNGVCDTGNQVIRSDGSTVPECTLRAAITETNFKNGPENILFDISGAGPHIIEPQTPLPTITDAVSIDGFTQPGASPNDDRDAFNGTLLVGLSGRLLPDDSTSFAGLDIVDDGSTIKGLMITAFPGPGITIRSDTASGNVIQGNRIGVRGAIVDDLSNPVPVDGNAFGGIHIEDAPGNLVGGGIPAQRNVISANRRWGVRVAGATASDNRIIGNLIGTDTTGTLDAGNVGHGVVVIDAPDNFVGVAGAGMRNVISGNDTTGVLIKGAGASGNHVQNNYIGTEGDGTGPLGNSDNGVFVMDAPNVVIGGVEPSSGNVIAANLFHGIRIVGASASGATVQGNLIGIDESANGFLGNGASGVRIDAAPDATIGGTDSDAANTISGNGENGIELVGTGASGTSIVRNVIGASPDGSMAIGNVEDGISIVDAPQTTIGGTDPGDANFIAANGLAGVAIRGASATGTSVYGNTIGADSSNGMGRGNFVGVLIVGASGTNVGGEDPATSNFIRHQIEDGVRIVSGDGNRVLGNGISDSGRRPINLDMDGLSSTWDGATPNDSGDVDTGANGLQNFPQLKIIGTTSTVVRGELRSAANSNFRIELFSNDEGAQAKTFESFVDVTTDGSGLAEFTYDAGSLVETITATATDASGNTSEVSALPTKLFDADLAVIKKVSPRAAAVGDTVRFSVRVNNNGPDGATGVTVSDPLPAGLTFLSAGVEVGNYNSGSGVWTVGDVNTQDSLSMVVFARVNVSDPVKNIATVIAGDQIDSYAGNNVASAVVNAEETDLSVTNVVDNPVAMTGETVAFTVTVANAGPTPATNVRLLFQSSAGLAVTGTVVSQGGYDPVSTTWDVGSVAVSGSATMTVSARVDSTSMQVGYGRVYSDDQTEADPSDNAASAAVNDDGRSTAAILRVIHAIANVALDTIDVYVDGVRVFDDLGFRESAETTMLAPGTHELAVTPGSAASVADSVSASMIAVAEGTTRLEILFDDPPAGVQMAGAANVPVSAVREETADVAFFNGVSDGPPLEVRLLEGDSGEGSLIRSRVPFAATSSSFYSLDARPYTFEFIATEAGGPFVAREVVAAITVDLIVSAGRTLALVLSGHPNPPAGYEATHYLNVGVVAMDGSVDERGSPVSNEVVPGRGGEAYELGANYPNPFAHTTTVKYLLPVPDAVTIEVFDVLGKRVAIVRDDEQTPAGEHELTIDLSHAPSGVYVYRLSAPGFVRSRTMMVVR